MTLNYQDQSSWWYNTWALFVMIHLTLSTAYSKSKSKYSRSTSSITKHSMQITSILLAMFTHKKYTYGVFRHKWFTGWFTGINRCAYFLLLARWLTVTGRFAGIPRWAYYYYLSYLMIHWVIFRDQQMDFGLQTILIFYWIRLELFLYCQNFLALSSLWNCECFCIVSFILGGHWMIVFSSSIKLELNLLVMLIQNLRMMRPFS